MAIAVPGDYARRFCETYGYQQFMWARANKPRHVIANGIHSFVELAIYHEQIEIFFEDGGWPIGYLIWAWLAPDVERRLFDQKKIWLHESEWNESRTAWILDFMVAPGRLKEVKRDVVDRVLRDAESINWARYDDQGQLRKITRRSRLPIQTPAPAAALAEV